MPRPYLVLAMRPDQPALSLEWPDAFGARWCSQYLKHQGWAVVVLRGLPPDYCTSLFRLRMPIVDRPFDPLYS